MLPFDDFVRILTDLSHDEAEARLTCIIESVQTIQGKLPFDDDCSLVEFVFDGEL